MNEPARRLESVRAAVPVDVAGAVLAESWSNDTWLIGGSVLRVCWRGDRERPVREAMLLESLPAAVPHATVLAAGHADDLTWMALRRLPGGAASTTSGCKPPRSARSTRSGTG